MPNFTFMPMVTSFNIVIIVIMPAGVDVDTNVIKVQL